LKKQIEQSDEIIRENMKDKEIAIKTMDDLNNTVLRQQQDISTMNIKNKYLSEEVGCQKKSLH